MKYHIYLSDRFRRKVSWWIETEAEGVSTEYRVKRGETRWKGDARGQKEADRVGGGGALFNQAYIMQD